MLGACLRELWLLVCIVLALGLWAVVVCCCLFAAWRLLACLRGGFVGDDCCLGLQGLLACRGLVWASD